MEVRGQLHASAALPLVKEPPVAIGEEAGWAPEPVWELWRREKSLASVVNQTPAVQPAAKPTELSMQLLKFQNLFMSYIPYFEKSKGGL
jgi:hypothetical protein